MVVITEDTIRNATTYIPIISKVAIARIGAESCVDTIDDIYRQTGRKFTGGNNNLPPRWAENTLKKELFVMGVFARYYLKLYADEKEINMEANVYDEYAESAVFNQLERLKSKTADIEIKNRIFDMLYDYKQLTKMLGAEINALLSAKNDAASRFFEGMYTQLTPDALQEAGAEMEKLTEELGKLKDELGKEHTEEETEDGE